MDWSRTYTAAQAAARHPHAYIHLSDGVQDKTRLVQPLLAVNIRPGHHDPRGIYFYPCSFVNNTDRHLPFQYGFVKKHYWVCTVDHPSTGIDLGRMTTAQADAIAARNGWLAELR